MLILKSLHIIGVVVWFAGLFYIGRLFVYHKEAEKLEPKLAKAFKAQYALMERRLYFAITTPGMVFALIFGISLLYYFGLSAPWIHVKLLLVLLLVGYHFKMGKIRRDLLEGICNLTSKKLRIINEVPSLLLVAIVFVVVLKDLLSALQLIGLVVLVGVLLGVGIKVYANYRAKAVD